MKYFLIIFLFSFSISACKKDNKTQPASTNNPGQTSTPDQYIIHGYAAHLIPSNGRSIKIDMYDINTAQYLIGSVDANHFVVPVEVNGLDTTVTFTLNKDQKISFEAFIDGSVLGMSDSLTYTCLQVSKNGSNIPGQWNGPNPLYNHYHN
jgi:hypothetical protein